MNDGQALDILDRQQCLNLLPRVRVGRLIFFDNGDPPCTRQLPFVAQRHRHPSCRRRGNSLLRYSTRKLLSRPTSSMPTCARAGRDRRRSRQPLSPPSTTWTVSGNFVQPWVEGRRDRFVRISSEKVTGRRIFDASRRPPHCWV